MLAAAQALTALALILAVVSIHPRLRFAMKVAWACVAGVALCLAGGLLLQ